MSFPALDLDLTFDASDDLFSRALGFVRAHGVMHPGCNDDPGCTSTHIVTEMEEKMNYDIATASSLGKGFFEVAEFPAVEKSLLVVDGFMKHPHALRLFGLSANFQFKGNHPGLRTMSFANHVAFRPIRQEVERIVGERLPYWCATFQRSFAHDTDNGVHRDSPTYKYSAMLYLNPEDLIAPNTDHGTSTWRHLSSRLYGDPRPADGPWRNKTAESALLDAMLVDPEDAKYAEVDRVGNRFNRLLVFNSRLNHRSSSLGGKGAPGSLDDARLVLIMFFNSVDHAGQENSVLYYDEME